MSNIYGDNRDQLADYVADLAIAAANERVNTAHAVKEGYTLTVPDTFLTEEQEDTVYERAYKLADMVLNGIEKEREEMVDFSVKSASALAVQLVDGNNN